MENKGLVQLRTELVAKHFRPAPGLWNWCKRKLAPKGTAGCYEVEEDRRVEKDRVVTDVFVNAIVDALQAATYINSWKYHDSGTGITAEAVSDTTLGTPTAEARDTGSQEEGATANIYKSIATHTYAGTFAITEHGLFTAATAGTLMDRTKFTAINVISGDKIEFTFTITFSSGG